jgi:hypothetical protein
MTEILRFKTGDGVRVIAGDAKDQAGTVQGLEPETRPTPPVKWIVTLDDGRAWLFETDNLEHIEE